VILTFFTILSCQKEEKTPNVVFVLEPRMDLDDNGYYHLELDTSNFQTLHRISGHIYSDNDPLENVKFDWESSHYWMLNDTVGYLVHYGYTDDLVYVSYDTTYIVGFNGFEVPTINSSSYSNSNGEVNTIFGPVRTMRGDTVLITVSYYLNNDQMYYQDNLRTESFGVVLE